MILVLGGTTEGRMAVQTLEEAGKPFRYSTKGCGQQVPLCHGKAVTGGMDAEAMTRFCREVGIRLLVDAAHPFAEELHRTVKTVADRLGLPVVRFERIYPDLPDAAIVWCRNYEEAVQRIREEARNHTLLALTGVQTIGALRPLWLGDVRCYFRILDRESSRIEAARQGFPPERLCYYGGEEETEELMRRLAADAVLLKESGTSGGFPDKVAAAAAAGVRTYAVRRPALPDGFLTVTGPHGLRRMVERLLPDFYPLRSGLTTGTCATAAAVAAVYALFGQAKEEVQVTLPDGEIISVPVRSCVSAAGRPGRASVVKDAGDDPDVTHGATICASVAPLNSPTQEVSSQKSEVRRNNLLTSNFYLLTSNIELLAGEGIGTVTLPGLGLPVGGPAINEVPRRMIAENIARVLRTTGAAGGCTVTLSVPEGRRLAERTFNPRLGVVGGISILGTSGIVKPFSSEAFVESIRKSMEVAQAAGAPLTVIHSGAKSERFLRSRYPDLPVQAFVHYGNFIGEALRTAHHLRLPRLVMGLMMGKAVKLAEGHLDTHSRRTAMNIDFLCRTATEAGCPPATVAAIRRITLARELWSLLPPDTLPPFVRRLLALCRGCCRPLFPDGTLTLLLISEEGTLYGEDGTDC